MTDGMDRDANTKQSDSVVRVQHDFGEDPSVASSVVTAVARANGVDPTELPPLQETVDGDALDALFASSETGPGGPKVVIHYAGYLVTVEGDGTVTASPDPDR